MLFSILIYCIFISIILSDNEYFLLFFTFLFIYEFSFPSFPLFPYFSLFFLYRFSALFQILFSHSTKDLYRNFFKKIPLTGTTIFLRIFFFMFLRNSQLYTVHFFWFYLHLNLINFLQFFLDYLFV